MILCALPHSAAMLLAAFVMLYSFVWWLSRRLDEIIAELKKK